MGKKKSIWVAAVAMLATSSTAKAACPTFHTLSNGTTADATAVMDNFEHTLQCPNFTGNVGIGIANATVPLHVYTPGGGTSTYAILENGGTNASDDIAALVVRGGATNSNWFLGTNRADIGGAAANFFLFNGTTASKSIVVTPTGNVGIGTTSPSSKLHLYTPGGGTSSYALIENGGTAANDDIAALLLKGGNTNAYWFLGTNRADVGGAAGNFFIYNGATANKTVVVTPAGNVGIGSATPNYAGYGTGSSVLSIYGTGQPGGSLELVGGTAVADGTVVGDVAFENTNLTTSKRLAIIRATMKGAASNDSGGQVDILTKANGGSLATAMTITNAGKVGIGTASPAQALEVNGQIKVNSLASASGTGLCINASVLSSCSSSRRYKEQIRDASFGLIEIGAMRPVSFKWKGRAEQDFGLIAEEVAKIDNRFVTYRAGRIEGVKYPQLTAVLIGAVKQLKAANDSQAAELAGLRIQNVQMMGQLKQVNTRLGALERARAVRTAENRAVNHHLIAR